MRARGAFGFAAMMALGAVATAWTASIGCGGSDVSGLGDDDSGVPIDDAVDDGNPTCGNKIVEGVEECDDGNTTNGDGCENDCTFTCKPGDALRGDARCDDKNACNGTEKCQADHTCSKGSAVPDGTSCGTGKVCKSGACIGSVCGDKIVTPPEECDDGNATNGDGCDSCKFSCVSTDATRDCTPSDACKGKGTCNDTTHVCAPGTPLADGSTCGTGKVCKSGTCVSGSCGDGVIETGEDCDFGSGNGPGSGCEVTCKFSCTKSPDSCPDTNVCNGTETCGDVTVGGAHGQKCSAGTPLAEGTSCGTGVVCEGGVCTTPPPTTCGNGTIDTGEQCDFGTGNGPGTGCETNCKFSCTMSPDSCVTTDACAGTNACTAVTVSGHAGQKCVAGTPPAACTACTGGGVCVSSACHSPTCGDGCITGSETCEPPGTSTCDAFCHTIVVAVCGNGVREGSEQCDDGKTLNLDGCSATCTFEQDQRANSVAMSYDTSVCTPNALGGAIGGAAQSQIKTALDNGVKAGSTTIEFELLQLDDLTGTSDPSLNLGGLTGKPVAAPAGVTYDGTNDLDWWYTTDASVIDPTTRLPTAQLPGSIAAKHLHAGPGTLSLVLSLGSGPAPVKVTNAVVDADVGATSKPTPSGGNTPGHLASENLDPTLVSFATMSNGKMCGNVSARSLASVPAPSGITGGAGGITCSEGYTSANSLLDVVVGGCHVLIFVTAIRATQPDQTDPSAASPGGAGGPYKLTEDSSHKVNGCKDKSGASVDMNKCLDFLAYSSAFTFTTDRVIAK